MLVTVVQICVAVVLLAPPGPLSVRYRTLIQHDSNWFANIIDLGYHTTLPPSDVKMMEVSNVAFFPAYPAVAALLRYGLHLDTSIALLVTAQIATWGFWSYFFLFCQRWRISPRLQFLGTLAVITHPAAFFLVAGYSESLFLMCLLGFMYWSSIEGRGPKYLAILHGFFMSATRIVGLPCAAFPLVRAVFREGGGGRDVSSWWRRFGAPVALTLAASLGAFSFFFYCFLRWGFWDMYMLTQHAGWGIEPDYLAIFRSGSYHWLIPEARDPRQASQMAMTLGAVSLVAVAMCELLPVIRRNATWRTRMGFYFCGAIIYYLSVSGVACVQMESMLRYEFCLHALIALAFVHFWQQLRPPLLMRAFALVGIGVLAALGLAWQSWFIWSFTRGGWVA